MNVADTLTQRNATHGDFETSAEITQDLKWAMHGASNWCRLSAPQQQALEQIATKIGRILNGDCDHVDNWHDIAGYAQLVERGLGNEGIEVHTCKIVDDLGNEVDFGENIEAAFRRAFGGEPNVPV